jgi:hypothetical protein
VLALAKPLQLEHERWNAIQRRLFLDDGKSWLCYRRPVLRELADGSASAKSSALVCRAPNFLGANQNNCLTELTFRLQTIRVEVSA